MRRRYVARLPPFLAAWIALAIAIPPCPAGAAELGALGGIVTDAAESPLAGATVALSHPARGGQGGAVTDARGAFRIGGLPPGRGYVLACSLPGFATVVHSEIEVVPGAVTSVHISLVPEGAVREEVRVRASPPVVHLSETTTQSRFSSEFIDSIPLLGRNYQDVLTLAPGVSDVDGDGNPNIHGARDTDVNTFVDGVSTTDPYTGKVGAQLNIESIQEIEVKTSGATAEFGRAQGGFANIITKSGGNQFEGAFKFFWRGSALDGDGAGIDDSSLHANVGESGLRDLTFNDYLPFLSFGGPIVKDRAWYFVTLEYIQREDPVNAVNAAFVTGVEEYRGFAKATWQMTPSTRLALSLNYDPQDYLNQGLNSLTREETGFTLEEGGTNVTLRSVSILSPSVVLEGTLGYLDSHPGLAPNLGVDNNRNGVLYIDHNGDGFTQASERDPGQDWDEDGAWDVWEDTHIRDGQVNVWDFPEGVRNTEDVDGDGNLTPRGACEGAAREDIDCDGRLDTVDEDLNQNGRLDGTEDLDGDRFLDRGLEDRNGNEVLDDTPFPSGPYPYGSLRPERPDRDYFIDEITGITDGPYYESREDTRRRATVRGDLSIFVSDFKGSHDFRFGAVIQRETFDRTTHRHDIDGLVPPVPPICDEELHGCIGGHPESLVAILPIDRSVEGSADGSTGALYAQDTWRPLPNLSVGLGLRYEHEAAHAPGWTYFDPRVQRDAFDALVTLSGGEVGRNDLLMGNRDGLANHGILGDPFVLDQDGGLTPFGAGLVNALRLQGLRHLLRHRSNLEFSLGALRGLYSGLGSGEDLDPRLLSDLGVTVQQPDAINLTNHNLSPRLSVSWDPAATGRTKVFATWGRYFDKLFLSTITGEQGPDTLARYYDFDADAITVRTQVQQGFTVTPNHGVGNILTKSAPSIRQVDRLLATPYCDEWTAGIEREIAPEVALAVRFIRREFRDQLQDDDINHETLRDPATGRLYDLFGILFEVPSRIPGVLDSQKVQLVDGRPDLFIQNPFFNQVLRVENSNTARYSAFEVELKRRMARRWELQGSYVYSRAQGNAEDYQSKVGNDPSVTESEYGYLSFDQRHVVKINAAVYLPGDWQLGFVTSWASALPYSVISRFFAFDNTGYSQFRTLYGFTRSEGKGFRFEPLPRNSERNGSVLNLDAGVRKSFVLGRNVAGVSLEVSNLLNSDDLRIFSYEPTVGSGYDVGGLAPILPLQLDATRRFGRRLQLGFRFSF